MTEINCSICLEDIQHNFHIFKTKCNHIFHKKCIESWAKSTTSIFTCPLCRNNIVNHKFVNIENIVLHYYVKDIGWVSSEN